MQFYTNFYQYGNSTLVREVRNGCKSKFKHKFSPTLYVPAEEGEFKTIQGQPLAPVEFETVKDAREFISQYKDTPNYQVCGNPRWAYSAIEELYPSTESLGIQFDPKFINVVYIDIETASGGDKGFPNIETANHEINAITIGFNGKTHTLGLQDIDPEVENNTYYYCKDEYTLLKNFIKLWKKIDPDVVTGWNIDFFDLPYIVNRIERILGEEEYKSLSPWGIVNKRQEKENNRTVTKVEIIGICSLDYIPLYKKFRLKMQESYKLSYISYVELGENKVDYSEFGSLHNLYNEDYKKFIVYNIHDVALVQRLEAKLGYISLATVIAYLCKTNYDDVFENIRLWDVLISTYLLKNRKTVIPAYTDSVDSDGYEGAFVKDPIRGKFDWVVSFDLTSLYPSIIRSFNISPDVDVSEQEGLTALSFLPNLNEMSADVFLNSPEIFDILTPILKEKNLAMCANGTLYRRDTKSFLADLMGLFFNERKAAKKKMLGCQNELELVKEELRRRGL